MASAAINYRERNNWNIGKIKQLELENQNLIPLMTNTRSVLACEMKIYIFAQRKKKQSFSYVKGDGDGAAIASLDRCEWLSRERFQVTDFNLHNLLAKVINFASNNWPRVTQPSHHP